MVMNKISTVAEPLFCSHFDLCSGCSLQGLQALIPPSLEAIRNYFSQRRINVPFFTGATTTWRTRAKLAVRGSAESPLIGLFRESSHEVVAIPHCQVHHPALNQAVEVVLEEIKRYQLEPYSETSGNGLVRYLQLAVERSTNRVQLVFVINCSPEAIPPELIRCLEAMEGWHSIWLNFQTSRDNIIFSSTWRRWKGEPFLQERIAGVEVAFHPGAFCQANLEMYELLVRDLKEAVPRGTVAVEYYAGVGVLGLSLVNHCKEVHCCEINPWAAANSDPRVSFHQGATTDFLPLLQRAEVVIVDPPRKGLDRSLLQELISPPEKLQKICYISCGWDSLQRDLDALEQAGWHIATARGYLFFPGTDHVELMATLTKDN